MKTPNPFADYGVGRLRISYGDREPSAAPVGVLPLSPNRKIGMDCASIVSSVWRNENRKTTTVITIY